MGVGVGAQAVSTSDLKVPAFNPPWSGVQLMSVWCFIAQTLSLSPLQHLDISLTLLALKSKAYIFVNSVDPDEMVQNAIC